MIQVDINNDPNFLKSDIRSDPRDNSLLVFQQNEDNAIITEYFNQLCGISEAIDSVAVLEEIQQKLEANPNPDAGTLRIAQITVEHLCSSLPNIEYSGPSMESFGTSREAALEGLGNWISAFFKAIFDAIKAVIDWVTSFFKSSQREARYSNRDEVAKKIKEKRVNGATADSGTIKNAVFWAIDPFNEVVDDESLANTISHAVMSVGKMTSIVKAFTGFIKEIIRVYDHVTVDELSQRDQMAISYNAEWNQVILNIVGSHSHHGHYDGALQAIIDRFDLKSHKLEKTMVLYDGFIRGQSGLSYQRTSTKQNYEVTHFEVIIPHEGFTRTTGEYRLSEIKSFEHVADMVKMYDEELEKMAKAIDDMSDPLKRFLSALARVQAIFNGVEDFKPTPLLHVGKIIASQAASLQKFMMLADQTSLQYEKLMVVVEKHYK